MKIWMTIRRPVGYALFTGLFIFGLIVVHAIPELLTNWILGI